MNKRIISIIMTLSLLLMLSSFPAASAAGEALVKVTASNSEIERGEAVTYTISFAQQQTVRGIQAGIIYDETKFEPQSAVFLNDVDGDASVSSLKNNNGMAALVLAYDEDIAISGDIAEFTFIVKEDAASGDAGFRLSDNGIILANGDGYFNVEADIDIIAISYDYTIEINALADKSSVCGGDEIIYTLNTSDINNIKGVNTVICYDTDILTLKDAVALEAITLGTYLDTKIDTQVEGKINVTSVYDEISDVCGDILKLTFEVAQGIEIGDYTPVYVERFEIVDADSQIADSNLIFNADPIKMERAYKIVMNYTPNKYELSKGEEVVYTVTLESVSESRGFQTELSYDTSKLELVSYEKGDVLSNAERVSGIVTDRPGKVGFVCAYDDVLSDVGVVATLTFKAKSSAATGYVSMSALSPLLVDDEYKYIDIEGINNIEKVYIGRLPREYDLSLTTDKDSYTVGETVYLTMDMGEVSKFLGIQYSLNFDVDMLEYIPPVRARDYYGNVMKNSIARSISGLNAASGVLDILVAFGESAPYSGNGDICTVAFKVLQDIDAQTELSISNLVSKNGDTVSINNKTITIEALPVYTYGYETTDNGIEVSIKNNSGCEEPVLITTQYDEDGRMLSVSFETIICNIGEEETYIYDMVDGCETVKCMLWKSIETMVPYVG